MRSLVLFCACFSFVGCVGVSAHPGDIVVQASKRVAIETATGDKRGNFFLVRSMLCRKVFTDAMTNLVAQTGRDEDSLRGATICGIDEGFTNGVYTLKLDVVWSPTREDAAVKFLSATNVVDAVTYVPSVDEGKILSTWIGPKQIWDSVGTVHFLGFSAMALGRNTVISKQNIRRAELDAQAMAVRSFMGKDRKMTDVKVRFREVFRQRSRHPLCPDYEMFACGYEVVSLEFPSK